MPDIIRFMDRNRFIAQEREDRVRDLTEAAKNGTGHPALVQAYLNCVGRCEPECFEIHVKNFIAAENFYATRGKHRTLAEITEDGTYGHVKDLEEIGRA